MLIVKNVPASEQTWDIYLMILMHNCMSSVLTPSSSHQFNFARADKWVGLKQENEEREWCLLIFEFLLVPNIFFQFRLSHTNACETEKKKKSISVLFPLANKTVFDINHLTQTAIQKLYLQ